MTKNDTTKSTVEGTTSLRRLNAPLEAPRFAWENSPLGPVEVRVNGRRHLTLSAHTRNTFAQFVRIHRVAYTLVAHTVKKDDGRWDIDRAAANSVALARVDGKATYSWAAQETADALAREAAERFAHENPAIMEEGAIVDVSRELAEAKGALGKAMDEVSRRQAEVTRLEAELAAARARFGSVAA